MILNWSVPKLQLAFNRAEISNTNKIVRVATRQFKVIKTIYFSHSIGLFSSRVAARLVALKADVEHVKIKSEYFKFSFYLWTKKINFKKIFEFSLKCKYKIYFYFFKPKACPSWSEQFSAWCPCYSIWARHVSSSNALFDPRDCHSCQRTPQNLAAKHCCPRDHYFAWAYRCPCEESRATALAYSKCLVSFMILFKIKFNFIEDPVFGAWDITRQIN